MKNIVFFDIDGTLLNDDLNILPSTIKAIKDLRAKGIEVAISTGRNPLNMKWVLDMLDIHTYISINGQYVVYQDEVIYQNPYPLSFVEDIEDVSGSFEHPAILISNDETYNLLKNTERSRSAFHFIDYEIPLLNKEISDVPVYQIVLICDKQEEKIYHQLFPNHQFVRFHEFGADVLPNGASKAAGIKKLIEHLNIPIENTYAFGDGLNDKEMLSFVGHGVAMGNAQIEVKETANIVTDTNNNDGIYKGLVQLGLLD